MIIRWGEKIETTGRNGSKIFLKILKQIEVKRFDKKSSRGGYRKCPKIITNDGTKFRLRSTDGLRENIKSEKIGLKNHDKEDIYMELEQCVGNGELK